jgi:hypothetical protein
MNLKYYNLKTIHVLYSCLQLKEAIVWTNNVSLGGGGTEGGGERGAVSV